MGQAVRRELERRHAAAWRSTTSACPALAASRGVLNPPPPSAPCVAQVSGFREWYLAQLASSDALLRQLEMGRQATAHSASAAEQLQVACALLRVLHVSSGVGTL